MRLLIIFLLLGIEAAAISSDDLPVKDTIPVGLPPNYPRKAKKIYTTGLVFSGAGAAALTGAYIGYENENYGSGSGGEFAFNLDGFGYFILGVLGAGLLATGIILFFVGRHKKRKVKKMLLSFKQEHFRMPHSGGYIKSGYPALSLRFRP